MKINKCTKLVCNVQDKEIYEVHIVALKQALNHGLKLAKVHKIIQFNPVHVLALKQALNYGSKWTKVCSVIEFRQKYWLKPYIDMNTELSEKWFWKRLL